MNGYNFTHDVRRVLQVAREEAAALDHEYVGTEHLLLGLLRTDSGVPTAVLDALNVDLLELRQSTLDALKRGKPGSTVGPDLPYTSRAKKVLEEAMSEARELHHAYVGTEHLLLGILRERKGVAAQSLVRQGLTSERVRTETIRILESGATKGGPVPPRTKRPPPGSVTSTFLIVIEDPNGQQGAQRFSHVQDAIDYLNRWRGHP